jgi:hypothetical protein
MAVSQAMGRQITNLRSSRLALFAVLLLSVFAEAVPLAEVHSHANASYGHAHDLHDHDAEGANNAIHDASADDAGQLHFHDTGVQSPTMLVSIDIAPVPCGKSGGDATPPATRPPDIPIAQLYRPPIA